MAFSISLSGLNAASSDLDVTSNNIANVATTGFKGSRAEFADIFAGSTSNSIGAGVQLSSVSQQFTQGNLNFTENTLDMSVSGEGFFVLKPNQTSNELLYTRAGAFQVNQNGEVANSKGQLLQVFPVNSVTGVVATTSLSGTIPLQVPNTVGTPQATSVVNLNLNLPALDAELINNPSNPDPSTYNNSTSATVFDSQGTSHIMTYYFVMTDDGNNTWEVRSTIDGEVVTPSVIPGGEILDFDPAGILDGTISTTGGAIGYSAFNLSNGAAPLSVTIDFRNSGNTVTQEAQGSFTVQNLSQDGFATGRLSGVEINDDGLVRASFTNGQSTALGKVALTRFDNPQGLRQIGNTNWVETVGSGPGAAGEAGTGNFGLIQSGALETANVDLTGELVNLITAQRNFQANSKAIETANTITQTIINIG